MAFDLTQLHVDQSHDTLTKDGKLHRQSQPIAQLAEFTVPTRDPLEPIKQVESALIAELIPMRHERMAASSFAFFRGTAELMAEDLAAQKQADIPVVASGDAHIGNFGFYASPERQLLFDLNDFDEVGVASFEFDVKRLLTSIVLAGQLNGFETEDLLQLVTESAEVYREGIRSNNELSTLDRFYISSEVKTLLEQLDASPDAAEFLQPVISKAMRHNSENVVDKFTTTDKMGHTIFRDLPPKSIHLSEKNYQEIHAGINMYRKTTRADINLLLSNYHVTDIIRHSVGVGSFGTRCYLVLLTSNDQSHLVLQVKEALPNRRFFTPHHELTRSQEVTEGQRIIDAQKILQKASDPFLGYFTLDEHSYYVRQFRDMKESIELTSLSWENFQTYAKSCAYLLASSHAQSPTLPLIAGYLGKKDTFDDAVTTWVRDYTQQVQKDYQRFVEALSNKEI
ncbi:DUF2252 domain-containing protein [Lacticaseibacillus saniviri]